MKIGSFVCYKFRTGNRVLREKVNSVKSCIKAFRIMRKEKAIDRYFSIGSISEPAQKAEVELRKARITVANYAKSKGINVRVSSAQETDKANKLQVVISKKKSPKKKIMFFIDSDTNKMYNYEVPRILHDPYDGVEYYAGNKSEHQDNFLRNFYRKLTSFVDLIVRK